MNPGHFRPSPATPAQTTRASPFYCCTYEQARREWRRKEKNPSPFERKGGLVPVRHEMAHILRHSDVVAPSWVSSLSTSALLNLREIQCTDALVLWRRALWSFVAGFVPMSP